MIENISSREKEVLHLVAYEYSSQEIANKLFISINTTITHRKNLMKKLKVKNSAGLVRRGFELGILPIETDSWAYSEIGSQAGTDW